MTADAFHGLNVDGLAEEAHIWLATGQELNSGCTTLSLVVLQHHLIPIMSRINSNLTWS